MLKKLTLPNGKNLNITYDVEYAFDKGQLYICKNNLVYLTADPLSMNTTKSFTFASDSMREKLALCLPITHKTYKVAEGSILVIAKSPDLFLLKDVKDYFKGAIPPVHIAWILNTIYNVCCFLEFCKITHGGITVDNFYIAPATHAGALLGGWWGAKVKSDVVEPLNRFSALVKKGKAKGDLEAVKTIGLELVGEQDVDEAIKEFLHLPSTGDAKADYSAWGKVLTGVFGPRKFIKMPFVEADLYKGVGDAVV